MIAPADQEHILLLARVRELERSHDELRAAIVFAGRHIRKLSFGKKTDPVLVKLRETLRAARLVRLPTACPTPSEAEA